MSSLRARTTSNHPTDYSIDTPGVLFNDVDPDGGSLPLTGKAVRVVSQ